MSKKLLWWAGAIVLVLVALSAYVGVVAGLPLQRARTALTGSPTSLDEGAIETTIDDLEQARAGLRSVPARVLGVLPVAHQNIAALRELVEGTLPAMRTAMALRGGAEELSAGGLMQDGRIDIARTDSLEPLLEAEIDALDRLHTIASSNLSGYLLPPVWDGLETTAASTEEVLTEAKHARTLFTHLPDLLGASERRRYLILLINNAELRGSGGLLSGLGVLSADDGRLKLDRLYSPLTLQTRPPQKVPVPEAFERFSLYDANTTFWRNVTFSPDFPDVATVAQRLFAKGTDIEVDGVLGIDPRGLAALLPADAEVKITGRPTTVAAADLPAYVYSDAYEEFEDQAQRREILLNIGAPVFDTVISSGLRSRDDLERAGKAAQEGHIRFVVFQPEVDSALRGLNIAGQVPSSTSDPLLVSAQNFGGGRSQGSKLDYWAKRHVTHRCSIRVEETTLCETGVEISNETPEGLVRYAAGFPYGLLRDYVEIFVDGDAELEAASLNGKEAEIRVEPHGDLKSVAVYIEVPRGDTAEVALRYSLPPQDSYRLEAVPQPLARTGRLSYALRFPDGWEVRGPGSLTDQTLRYSGPHDQVIDVRAAPGKLRGLSAFWSRLFG